jgi:hypothetical protein
MFITTVDLAPFAIIDPAKAMAMIEDAEALAITSAPLLVPAVGQPELTDQQKAAVRAILRTAILRWNEAGNGAVTTQTAAIFGMTVDTRTARFGGLTNAEIDLLKAIVTPDNTKAFSIDLAPRGTRHAPWCNLAFGSTYCSCGADLAGYPIYELGGDE